MDKIRHAVTLLQRAERMNDQADAIPLVQDAIDNLEDWISDVQGDGGQDAKQ